MSRAQEERQTARRSGEKKSPKKCIMSRWLCRAKSVHGKILEKVRGITINHLGTEKSFKRLADKVCTMFAY